MTKTPILFPVLLWTLAACGSTNRNTEFEGRASAWSGDAIRSASLNQAIIAQHTLYSYHFISGSAQLNELGDRDLNVLADHFAQSPGDLNVRRGDTPQVLYESRVKAVLERLAAVGIQSGAVAVKDGLPGGEGLSAERVIVIMKEKMASGSQSGSVSGGSSAVSGSAFKSSGLQ